MSRSSITSTDVLEAAYTEFYESMGIRLHPVSNFTRDFEALFEDPIDVLIVTGGGTLHPKYYVEPHKAASRTSVDFPYIF